jgi:hypothetical protein
VPAAGLVVLLLSLLPARYELLDREALWHGISGLFTELRKTGVAPPLEQGTTLAELQRIKRRQQEMLQGPKKGRPILQELLRFALYGLFVCMVLALVGAWAAHHYRFRQTPVLWRFLFVL